METKEFYSVREAMAILNVKRCTIYKYRNLGILKCYKPAGLLYFTYKSIHDFLKSRS